MPQKYMVCVVKNCQESSVSMFLFSQAKIYHLSEKHKQQNIKILLKKKYTAVLLWTKIRGDYICFSFNFIQPTLRSLQSRNKFSISWHSYIPPWSWPTSDLCNVGTTEALNSGGFRCCFLRLRCSSGPQGLRGLPQGLTSGPHFYLRASPAQKLPIILDQGPPRFLRGPEVNFPNKWMATVQSTSQACQVKWYSNCSK